MKTKSLLVTTLALLCGLSAITGCKKSDEPVAAAFEFNVTAPDGKDITAVRQFNYGDQYSYSFTAKGLKKVEATAPQGWSATATVASKAIAITAPSAKDNTAAESGDVKVTATSTSGETKEVILKVAVSDAAIAYTVKNASAEPIGFTYGQEWTSDVEASNVETVDVAGLEGWTVAATAAKVSITAPTKDKAAAAAEGTITLTPKSAKGNAGTAVAIKVFINVAAPALEFEDGAFDRIAFGDNRAVAAKIAENVEKVEAIALPKGWKISYDAAGKKLTVTAPSFDDANADPTGTIVLNAISKTNDTLELSINVSVVGINSLEDFAALAGGASPAPYVYNNELVINNDIDLSAVPGNVLLAKLEKAAVNGRNHTITIDIKAGEDVGNVALIGEVIESTIKNLNVAGSITCAAGKKAEIWMSAITRIAKYSRFENINNYATLTQTGTNGDSWGKVGAIIADAQAECQLINCHNYGKITVSSPKFLGGLIGDIYDNADGKVTKGSVENCSNEADIVFNLKGLKSDDLMAGGVIGNAKGSNWTYKNSYNTGNISYDVTDQGIRALGGFIGMANGNFENCYNTGNVTNTKFQESTSGVRRIGGFAGATWDANGQDHYSKNCYNTGNVTDLYRIGGFIGSAEASAHFDGDYNTGRVISVSQVGLTEGTAGFCGHSCNDVVFENCNNKGVVICATYRASAGFCVCADNVKIKNCKNEGEIKSGASTLALGKDYAPIVAGLAAIRGDGSKCSIENSQNTANVTGFGQWECSVQRLYACEGATHKALDPAWDGGDTNTVDDASKAMEAASTAKLTYYPKAQWSNSIVLSWLQ